MIEQEPPQEFSAIQPSTNDSHSSNTSQANSANMPNGRDTQANYRAGWSAEPVSPWRRYGARTLDTVTSGSAGFLLLGIVLYLLAPITADRFFANFDGPTGRLLDIFFSLVMAGFVNAVVLAATGSTMGKAIFGIRVLKPGGAPLGLADCFKRELKVWVVGLGLGLPIVSLITMTTAYSKLKNERTTTWDAGKYEVIYRQQKSQTALNIVGVVIIVAAHAVLRWLETI